MSNAIIKQQGPGSVVADNIWEFRLGAGSFVLGAAAGAVAATAVGSQIRAGAAARPSVPTGWPINFAHRGGAKVVPEDTLEGFREAVAMGAGVLETDVQATADGHIVLMHDKLLDRTTDATGPVAERTLAELKQVDAAYRFTPDGGATYPWRGKGVRIPTLAALYQEFPDRPVNIEVKGDRPGIEEAIWRVIAAADAQARTIVVADRRATIARFREASGNSVATGAAAVELAAFWLLTLLGLERLWQAPFQAVQAPEKFLGLRVVSKSFVRRVHRRGLRVDVWTIDDEPAMRRLLSYGVDGIMTDRPDLLARILGPGS